MSLQRFAAAALFCCILLPAPSVMLPAIADTPPVVAPEPIVPPTDADKALVERAYAAAKLDPGTPGLEAMNFMMNDWPKSALDTLSGKTPATEKQLEGARGIMSFLLPPMEKGPTWPLPVLTHAPHARGTITIDGKLDDPGWKNALTYHGGYIYNEKDHVDNPSLTVKMSWDENNLYYAFDCQDPDIIAPPLARDMDPFDFDAVEMFVLPQMTPPQYWELVIGPQGAIYDGLHLKALDHWGTVNLAIPDKDHNIDGLQNAEVIEKDAAGKSIGYQVEVAIPFAQLPTYTNGRRPRPGDMLHVMLARMDKNGDKQTFYSVVPLLSWGHNIWNYIPVKLEKSNFRDHSK